MTEIEIRYRQATAADMGIEVGRFDTAQTILLPEPERAGSSMVVAYHIGKLAGLRCDPMLESDLSELVQTHPNRAVSFEEMEAWAANDGWEYVDGGDVHLLLDGLIAKSTPTGARQVSLSREVGSDRDLIASLLESSNEDDVDASEFEMDELDPLLLGLLDVDDQLGALVGGRVWEEDAGFDDIGVLVRGDLRGRGWGSAAVSTLCEESIRRGRIPLYRCNWSRGPSKATAMTLGFKQVGTLVAYRKPAS